MSQASEVARMSESNWLATKWAGVTHFYRDVKQEMKRVSWPSKNEVFSTTVVVVVAVTFFGFFLWAVDVVITLGFEQLTKWFTR